jgi:hypothetical protein
MSEDINIKIKSDESGAVAAFKRFRHEVLNNEKAIKEIGTQGRLSGEALKNVASFLGPEFQILGDRIDHVSGALGDMKEASLVAKATLVGLVAVGGFQVGQMLGNLVFQTDEFNKSVEDMKVQFTDLDRKLADFVAKQYGKRVAESVGADAEGGGLAALFGTDATVDQLEKELAGIGERLSRASQSSFDSFTENYIKSFKALKATSSNPDDIKRLTAFTLAFSQAVETKLLDAVTYAFGDPLAMSEEQIAADKARYDQLLKMRDELLKKNSAETDAASAVQRQADATRDAAQADRERMRVQQEQQAVQDRLIDQQVDYIQNLRLEKIRVEEGEEAYERARLKRLGFMQQVIDEGIRLKRIITERKEAETDTVKGMQAQQIGRIGVLKATQQRFITRGTGSSVQDKILQEMKQQIKLQQEQLAETRKTNNKLSKIPTEAA